MPILGTRFRLRTQFRAGLPDIIGDPAALERAAVNLVLNARDSMAGGGTVTLSASSVQVTEADAERVAGARAGNFVCLSVSDTGCGISPDVAPLVFEPFFTTRDVGEGVGLGLSVAHGIAVQHFGWVELSSEPGAGTECRLYLPIATQEEAKKVQ
jgi:signal transduction histidine kinase